MNVPVSVIVFVAQQQPVDDGVIVDGALWGIPIGTLTPSFLLGIVILAIVTGRLVPRRTMDDAIHDKNEWRTAHRISESSRAELVEMVEELLEYAKTTDAFIRAALPGRTPPAPTTRDYRGSKRPPPDRERPDG